MNLTCKTAALLSALAGCAGGTGDASKGERSDCVGDYTGSYEGADEGAAAATLEEDGTLVVLFTSDSGEVNATGVVTEEGDVSGEEGSVSITGSFDFSDCTAGGNWSSYGQPSGSWELSLQ